MSERARLGLRREMALVFLVGVLPMMVLGATLVPPAAEEPPSPFPHLTLPEGWGPVVTWGIYLLFVLSPWIAMARSGEGLDHFGTRWTGKGTVLAGLVCLALNYLTGWMVWGAYWLTGFPLGEESIRAYHYFHASSLVDMLSVWPWYVMVVFAEESMARCYWLTRIQDLTGSPRLAIVGSSLLYAGWHMFWGWAGFVHVFTGGLLFGLYFVRTRGVWAPAIAHFLFDGLTLLPR